MATAQTHIRTEPALTQPSQPASRPQRHSGRALGALALANARYWPTVMPLALHELRRWERRAQAIPDPQLRALALHKLHTESFNAEAAAIAATLAPRPVRPVAVRAIVALELLFDYLDGLTEMPLADPVADGEELFGAFTGSVVREPEGAADSKQPHGYVDELAGAVKGGLAQLPSSGAVEPAAARWAALNAQAQVRVHAASLLGTQQAEQWARGRADGSGLGWREFLAGAASSVLALHALIAAAADPHTTETDAERIAHAYLSIAAVVTLLDGLVDWERDTHAGEVGYLSFYDTPEQLAEALCATAHRAAQEAAALPNGAHHVMTLAGAVAYWGTTPGADGDFARPVLAQLRSELAPLVGPPLAVMRTWRAVKRLARRRGAKEAMA